MTPQPLELNNLSARHRGLTPAIADYFHEAARVCLDRHHLPPVDVGIDVRDVPDDSLRVIITWTPTDDRIRAAWANTNNATEKGAYACVLAAVELTCGLVAVRQAETGSGVDYYLSTPGGGVDDLEDCVRLEVSGVDSGSLACLAMVNQRLRAKLDQAASGPENLPAMAGVAGFLARLILLERLKDQ